MIIWVNVVLNRTVVVNSDWRLTCVVVIFRVKVSCITSGDGIILWLLITVTVNNNSPIQDYVHPDDQTQPTNEIIWLYIVLKKIRTSTELHWTLLFFRMKAALNETSHNKFNFFNGIDAIRRIVSSKMRRIFLPRSLFLAMYQNKNQQINGRVIPYYRKLTLHEIKVLEINAT